MKKVVHLLLHPVLTKTLRLFQVGFIEAGNWKLHNMDSILYIICSFTGHLFGHWAKLYLFSQHCPILRHLCQGLISK